MSSGKGLSPSVRRVIYLISVLAGLGLLMTLMGTFGETQASTTADASIQNPGEISAMMTQASEEIENELVSQGDKLRNQLTNTFGFNEIQSQLALGYQFSFEGNIPEAISQVEMADSALADTISSVFRTGQELTLLSQNNSLPLDNNTTSAVSGRRVSAGGIAFAGSRGISKVEVSIDNGATWKDAVLKEPLSQYAWVLWAAELNLMGQQHDYKLSVRATDKAGNVQTSEIREPFPDGATGYHMINIQA